jgi:tetratricopeptide (TPR) repeat protein
MLRCRKCAYPLEDGESVPERCPNCGTSTRAPEPEAPPPVALGTVWGLGVGEVAVPKDRSIAAGREPEDLPTPVASSRPFTLPTTRRITVPAATAATNALESSAELDLPIVPRNAPSETVVAPPRPPGSTRPDDLELDLDDLHGEAASEVATSSDLPPAPPAPARRERLRVPAPRPLPAPMVAPSSAPAEPPPALRLALVGLTAVLLGLGWFYFSRGLGEPVVAGADDLSSSTWPEGYLKIQAQRLDVDRAAEYLAALAEAEAVGDPLGRAEAALCMHLRYGPDLVRRSSAAVWRRQAGSTDPRAQRVAGLAALADGDEEEAERLLADGDDARTHLYRALAAQQRDALEVAAREAAEALALRSNDTAAALVAATATLAARWDAPLTGLQAALETHPGHPLYQQALLRALIDRGRLQEARELVLQLQPVAGASAAHQARVQMLKAELALTTGEFRRAQREADLAWQLAPQDVPTQLARARLLQAVGEDGRAQQELVTLVRGPAAEPGALALQAELAIRAGNESVATRAIDRLANAPGSRAQVALLRGRVHALRGRDDEAAAAYSEALAEAPADVDAAIALAELRVRRGAAEPLAAIVRVEALLRANPRAARRAGLRALTLAHANLLVETGRKDQALAVLDAALAADPDDNAAQLRRGVLAGGALGRADLVAVQQRTGGFPGLVWPLGQIYLREGDLTALAGLLQSHSMEPPMPDDVAVMRGLLRLAQQDPDAADENIDRVLLRNPGMWEAHLAKARVLFTRDRLPEALAEVRLARPHGPDAEVELWIGKIAERSGKPQEAAAAFRRAHQLDPSLLEATFLNGRVLLSQGLAREAITELQAVTRVTDMFPAAHLALGLALRERELLPEALESFIRATSDKSPGEAHYWAGRTAAELKRLDLAAEQLGHAVLHAGPGAPWLADAQLWLGRTQHRRDRRAEARAALTAYLQLAGPRAPARAEAQRLLRER